MVLDYTVAPTTTGVMNDVRVYILFLAKKKRRPVAKMSTLYLGGPGET